MPELRVQRPARVHWYWWALWLIVLAIIAFFFWVWGWGPRSLPAGTVRSAAAPVTDYLVIVNAPNRQALEGRVASLRNLTVQEVVNGGVFWAGEKGQEVLVVGSAPALQPGALVSVQGVIRGVPPDVEQRWNLTPGQATQAQSQGLYVAATRIAK